LDWMVTSITRIQSPLDFLLNQQIKTWFQVTNTPKNKYYKYTTKFLMQYCHARRFNGLDLLLFRLQILLITLKCNAFADLHTFQSPLYTH
jgi:hypothetical protein